MLVEEGGVQSFPLILEEDGEKLFYGDTHFPLLVHFDKTQKAHFLPNF